MGKIKIRQGPNHIALSDINSGSEFEMVATCMQYLEPLLEEELIALGAKDIQVLKRAVSFRGPLELLYRSNLWLRTALKVLVPICSFKATLDDELYEQAKSYPWEDLFDAEKTFSIDAAVHSEHFSHSQFALLKLKDAIVDRFREKASKRPNIERDDPDIRIHLHVRGNEINISLDSSGDALFKRGYKREQHKAPINECLAAALILKSGWKGEQTLFDPMCGSATIAIEAALIHANIPPNMMRNRFGFEDWSNYDGQILSDLLEEARSVSRPMTAKIIARDKDFRSLRAARININAARMKKYIEIEEGDFFKMDPPVAEGMMIFNPPYGQRLGEEEDMIEFYEHIGSELKHSYSGWTAWLISSDIEALKRIGLKADEKHPLMNGKLECQFRKFSLFEGTRIENIQRVRGRKIVVKKEESDSEE